MATAGGHFRLTDISESCLEPSRSGDVRYAFDESFLALQRTIMVDLTVFCGSNDTDRRQD